MTTEEKSATFTKLKTLHEKTTDAHALLHDLSDERLEAIAAWSKATSNGPLELARVLGIDKSVASRLLAQARKL